MRHEGQALLDLVERVRVLSKATRDSSSDTTADHLDALLSGVDLPTATLLVRAFSAYFHLANIAEQVHRADERTQLAAEEGPLGKAVDEIAAAGLPLEEVEALLDRLELRLVLTAHPTEAVRQSILAKRRRIAELLEERAEPARHRGRPPPRRARDRRGRRPHLADRRAAAEEADAGRGGQLRRLLPRRPVRRRPARTCSTTSPPTWPASASSWPRGPGPSGSAPGSAATATATPTSPRR